MGLSGVLRVKLCGRLLADKGQLKSQPGSVEVPLTYASLPPKPILHQTYKHPLPLPKTESRKRYNGNLSKGTDTDGPCLEEKVSIRLYILLLSHFSYGVVDLFSQLKRHKTQFCEISNCSPQAPDAASSISISLWNYFIHVQD